MGIGAVATAWPEADRLFRSDPRWLGGDGASSIPLASGRVLWLFGDSFVAPRPGVARTETTFVHNTIGVQSGADPASASMGFHWRDGPEGPEPFFPAPPGTWVWPLHGARIGDRLLLFFMRVRSTRADPAATDGWERELNLRLFEVHGWSAAWVDNPDDEPSDWRIRPAAAPDGDDPVILGCALIVRDDHLHAYGWKDGHVLRPGRPGRPPRWTGAWRGRRSYLARWPLAELHAGRLGPPEWWCGDGWDTDRARSASPIQRPATEFSVHAEGDALWQVQAAVRIRALETALRIWRLQAVRSVYPLMRTLKAVGLARTTIMVRSAEAPEGPWSEPVPVFVPEEASRLDAIVYAAKAHPHLEGAGLAVTYATNADRAGGVFADEELYYPRFVRLDRVAATRRLYAVWKPSMRG